MTDLAPGADAVIRCHKCGRELGWVTRVPGPVEPFGAWAPNVALRVKCRDCRHGTTTRWPWPPPVGLQSSAGAGSLSQAAVPDEG